jgi:hypothetical protein
MPYEPPAAPPPPTRLEVEEKFVQLVNGSLDRDTADRWAMRWVAARDPGVEDDAVWWGLTHLYGIDMPDLDRSYLHSDEQIAEWLDTYRELCRDAG